MTGPAPLALVTGAGIRLGRAVSEGLAAEGMRLALHYHRHQEQAEELARQIESSRRADPRPDPLPDAWPVAGSARPMHRISNS